MIDSGRTGDARFVSTERQVVLSAPVEIVVAYSVGDVVPCLERVSGAVRAGLHAAGYLAYEAAPALNRFLKTHGPGDLPLLWFGLYEESRTAAPPASAREAFTLGQWETGVTATAYAEAIGRIRELIAAGDTYQVNYTFPMWASFGGDPAAWFDALWLAQRADYAAYLDTGRFKVLSASPELFFRLENGVLVTRPMKGTRPRGRWAEEDAAMARELAESEKDQAENVMIVDLLRNDMGRISETGTVAVDSLFTVERYETLWQMTSTIRSQTRVGVPEILKALFPSGSVTGAPKVRTMEIIREIEPYSRGVYCGAVGWWSGRSCSFNVAIRTAVIDAERQAAEYHVGGGVTWGSTPEGEYEECFVKARVVAQPRPEFQLLESLLYDANASAFFLLDEHMDRLVSSAAYFGFACDRETIRAALIRDTTSLSKGLFKVRLLLDRGGCCTIQVGPAPVPRRSRISLAREPVDESNPFLFHKTTNRSVYDQARASRPGCDDVLLWNRKGELTETTVANVALRIGGAWLTPPVSSGLLGGTMRRHLLEGGVLREQVLTIEDAARSEAIKLINSVRKWVDAEYVP